MRLTSSSTVSWVCSDCEFNEFGSVDACVNRSTVIRLTEYRVFVVLLCLRLRYAAAPGYNDSK
jgi:hypothetical protein